MAQNPNNIPNIVYVKSESRGHRVARRVGKAAAGLVGLGLATGAVMAGANYLKGNSVELQGNISADKGHTFDGTQMLADQLRSDPTAANLAQQMQDTLKQAALARANVLVNEYKQRDSDSSGQGVTWALQPEFGDGVHITDYTISRTFADDAESVTFGATPDGKNIDLTDLKDVSDAHTDDASSPTHRTVQTIQHSDETGRWDYVGRKADEGRYSDSQYALNTAAVDSYLSLTQLQQDAENAAIMAGEL